jgi:hypothetical protein
MSKEGAEIWIGQAEVTPAPGNTLFEGQASGGFIAGMAHANTADEFAARMRWKLETYGVVVVEVSGARRLDEVLAEKSIEASLQSEVGSLTRDRVVLGTLFTYNEVS